MKNKSINIKEEILKSYEETFIRPDKNGIHHLWNNPHLMRDFLSNSLDRMESEVREETINEFGVCEYCGCNGYHDNNGCGNPVLKEKPKA